MARLDLNRLGALLAVALLALAPFTQVLAQEQHAAGEETTLTGQLSTDGDGGYMLVEEESGDSIPLVGPSELADYVGSTVKVTGKWAEDAEGTKYFEVSRVEAA